MVEPFFPAPPEHILSMVETAEKMAHARAMNVGTMRSGKSPNSCIGKCDKYQEMGE